MGIIRLTFGLIFILVIVMYSVQNLTPVDIGYYNHLLESKAVRVPLIVVIFSSFLSGFIMSWAVNFIKIYRLKSHNSRQKREMKKLAKISDKQENRIVALTEETRQT